MEDVAIIIASHGYFAQEALKSAEMIVGKQSSNKVKTLAMNLGVDLEQFKQTMMDTVKEFGEGRKVLILTDVIGGTPNNAAVFNLVTNKNVQVICGVNLPMLLETFTNQDMSLEKLTEHLLVIGGTSVMDVNKLFNKKGDEI